MATEAVAEAQRLPASASRSASTVRSWSLLLVVLLVTAFAVWLTSPRFAIDSPSLVDDWSAIARAPDQLADVLRLENPEQQRFRPGWILWNYLQWHTLDAPQGLVGPNLWNLARTLVLVAGLCLLTALAMPWPRRRSQAILQAGLAALPALLVLTVPKLARDLARFGVQEPLLVGGTALGGSLLVLAGRELLGAEPLVRPRVAALGVAGSALWIVGAYQKEASLSVPPLLVAVLIAGRGRLTGWRSVTHARRAALTAIAGVVLVPLAHVALESVRIVARGDLVYDAKVDAGRGILSGLEILYDWSREVFSTEERRIVLAAFVLTGVAALVRRRIDAVAVAALASGALTLVFAAQSGVAVSRYYLPAYALAVVALSLSLARLSAGVQVAGLVMLVLLAFSSASEARQEVRSWTDEERAGTALVDLVAELHATGCPVAVAGLDVETTQALPVLVSFESRAAEGACRSAETYLVLRLGGEGAALARACAAGALLPLLEGFVANVYRCARLRAEPVRDPTLGLVEPERLVTVRRLRPGVPAA